MRYLIPKADRARHHRQKVIHALGELSQDKTWQVTIIPYVKKRSPEQNSFLHAVPLRMICDHTGNDVEDIKDYLLGECFGWEEFQIMNKRKVRPVRRSSSLDTGEMTHFIAWIEAWAAQNLDLIIPRPNEEL